MRYPDGKVIEGNFKDGVASGQGKIEWGGKLYRGSLS